MEVGKIIELLQNVLNELRKEKDILSYPFQQFPGEKRRSKCLWIPEKLASGILQIEPGTLRRHSKSGRLDISFTHINGRNFFYDLRSIEKLLDKNARIVH
jgi:hypothetical protein